MVISLKQFSSDVFFRGSWRSYQKRVLDELQQHLDDRRLHVVAAPGSGKTILGLEVLRRLNKPTLIVSPTISIRDQWIHRFKHFFCPPHESDPSWISKDIRSPSLLTSTTYQGLHAASIGAKELLTEEDLEEENQEDAKKEKISASFDLVKALIHAGVQTLVVDEAHHLRAEWWKTLMDIQEQIPELKVVALTATPPYDVPYSEWKRYEEFCGPVDEEISVPELVADENLCPHQDYVYLTSPSEDEKKEVAVFYEEVNLFLKEILTNQMFIDSLARHPFVIRSKDCLEPILDNPEYASSLIVFLNHAKSLTSFALLKLLGVDKKKIPPLDLKWMEVLLSGCLWGKDQWINLSQEDQKKIQVKLSRMGAVDHRRVMLRKNKRLEKLLIRSMSKLDAIHSIVEFEAGILGERLRQVILTDFICREYLTTSAEESSVLKHMGVVPIFEKIRREFKGSLRLGCLCGSLTIIPESERGLFSEILAHKNVSSQKVEFIPLNNQPGYLEIKWSRMENESMVSIMTELFTRGGIHILVGTKSLLGEGWDAPCINSLILATFVGSFVLSNQMRGRAIRSYGKDPLKAANIWHLACIQRQTFWFTERGPIDFGQDYELMQRRFMTFVGLSNRDVSIENGWQRLDIDLRYGGDNEIKINNERTLALARDRQNLREKWKVALGDPDAYRLVHEIQAPQEIVPRPFIFQKTLRWLLFNGGVWGLYFFQYFMRPFRNADPQSLLKIIFIAGLGSLCFALPSWFKAAWLFFRYGSVEGCMRQIGEALMRSLCFFNLIQTHPSKLQVVTQKGNEGAVACQLKGGTSFEKELFLDSLREVLSLVENPRYLLVRKSLLFWWVRIDFHAVPSILGTHKEKAEYFQKMWKKYVGPADLIYARTEEGRHALVKARSKSFANHFAKKAERRSVWS